MINTAQAAGRVDVARNEVPRLEAIGNRFEVQLEMLARQQSRLAALADRICGPIPEAVEKGAPATPAASASAHRLEQAADMIDAVLRRLELTTNRLETL